MMGELKVVDEEPQALPVYEKTYSGKHQLHLLEDTFDCVDQPPTGFILKNADKQKNGDAEFLNSFFKLVVKPEQLERLYYVLDYCGFEELQEQMQYVWEKYTGRPTGGASSSRGGSTKSKRK